MLIGSVTIAGTVSIALAGSLAKVEAAKMAKVASLDKELAVARRLALNGDYTEALTNFDAVLGEIDR